MQEVFEKIIERLHKEAKTLYSLDSFTPVGAWKREDAIEVVKEAATEYNNGWVACSEYLPDKEGYYLVSLGYTESNSSDVDLLHYDNKNGFWFHDEMQKTYWRVIAWKPLPEPYQPKED